MSKRDNKEKFLDSFYYLPLFWIATGMFWFSGGDKTLVAFVLVSAIVSLLRNGLRTIIDNWNNGYWLKIVFTYATYAVVSYYYYDFGSRELRASLVALVYLATLPRASLSFQRFKWIVLLASINCLAISTYYQFIVPTERILWPVNAIPFATFSALVALVALGCTRREKNTIWKVVLFVSFCAATVGAILTQTRGIIVSLVVVLPIVAIYICMSYQSIKKRWLALIGVALFLSGYASAPLLEKRVTQTFNEIANIQRGNMETSIGLRLSMYQNAIDISAEKPVFGHGKQLQPYIDGLLDDKKISRQVHHFMSMNFHSGYLEKLVVSGVIGLALMLLVLLYPLVLSIKNRSCEWSVCATGAVSLVYILANITDTPFTNGHSFVSYLIFIGVAIYIPSTPRSRGET